MNFRNVLLAFIAFILAVSAQAQTFTRSGEVPLSDALNSIEQQTGYLFVYDSAGIDCQKKYGSLSKVTGEVHRCRFQ